LDESEILCTHTTHSHVDSFIVFYLCSCYNEAKCMVFCGAKDSVEAVSSLN